MNTGNWARLLLVAVPFMTGCAGFWSAPSSNTSFTLSNSGNITESPGATSGNTSTITVTPSSSFAGTVALTCAITSAPNGATSPTTCSLSPASVVISANSPQTSALTAATTSSTTAGAYQLTVTGTSGSATNTTTLCAEVTSSTGSCTASSGNNSGVFYVLNQGSRQVAAYSIVSGTLAAVNGSPYTLSAAPFSIAIAPGGNFLYVGTATGIFLYTIGSGGALTLANNNNVISQDIATTMQVDATGSWLVEAGPNLAELLAIHINSSSGVPTSGVEQNTLLPAATVQQLSISPDNAHVFVALGSSGTEDVTFAAGNTTPFGGVANLHVLSSGGAAVSVAVDPKNRLLYVGETAAISGSNSGGLRVIDYNTLVEVTGSPYATGGLAPYAIAPTRSGSNSGNFVYVANRTVSGSTSGNIVGFSVNSSGTGLTALNSSVSAGITPLGLTQDSSGNYMLVVNSGGSPDLQAFTFDATTAGKLDSALTSATGNDPVQASSIAAAP
ncbi:MAG TPA: beta-propeller fold lactonase family protein [Terracidiphilus sp.]|nr:beta-propeller fold lactonase family protein [Terracidiphilus sp.]